MPELTIRYHENRQKCVVKQDPDVKVPPPLPNGQPQVESTEMVEPPNATPALGGISKPCFRQVTEAGPGALRPLQNGLHSGIPVPFTIVPNHPSFKEQLGASSDEDSSSSQPHSDIPAQQSSVCQFGGPSAAREVSRPIDAQVPSKSSLTHSEHLDELKQQVAHILARHPEGMSLFQFRATYSMTYQHHLPLGNASSAKQRLLEMSDIVSMKGCGVQTLLLPVSPEEPPPKLGPPVFSRVENAAMVLADSLPKAVVRPESVVVSKPSLLKTPIQPQPYATHPLASDHLRTRDVKENSVPPTELFSTIPTVVQKPVGPKVILRGHSDSSKTEAAKNLGNFLPEAVVKIEPVVIPESSSRPLSRTAAVPVPQLLPSVPSSSTCLRASSNKESSFRPESLPPQIPKPSVPVEKNVRFRIMPGENLLIPHSPVIFPADIDSFNPAFSVNVPVPSLFQPVLANITMSQPVVYFPLTHLPHTPASSQSVSRTLSTAQLQKTELVSSHLTQPASQGRTAKPTSPIQHAEQIDHTHAAEGIDALQSTSRTWGPGRGRAPGFSADGCPVSSPSVKPPSLQPLNSPSIQQLENVHHTWLSSMPCSSVPTVDDRVVASSSARVPSKPVVPAHQKQYDVVDAPVTTPRTPLSSVSHQPASSSYRSHTESDTAPFNPLVSMPQPHHIRVDSAVASSNAHPSILHSSQGSPISTASQPSYVSFRPKTGYDASHHSKPLPGVSREGSGQDSHLLTLGDNQKYHFKEESTQPSALQNSPPPRRSDNCVIL
ncbi:uncharacterized protein LOC132583936 [Heteronotia binoei]|uniref:uncharacterized protein LOC132583936 n=1 Tax=Heteronotia binoei TaxID=13085 RepID=UPI00292EB3F0|nr:uncharacterized protein LOC132583936 [Heteronotia binoei]